MVEEFGKGNGKNLSHTLLIKARRSDSDTKNTYFGNPFESSWPVMGDGSVPFVLSSKDRG